MAEENLETLSNHPNAGTTGGDAPLSFDEGVEALEGLLDSEEEQPEAKESPQTSEEEQTSEAENSEETQTSEEGNEEDETTETEEKTTEESEEQGTSDDVLSWEDELEVEIDGKVTTLKDLVDGKVQDRAKEFQRDYTAKTTAISEKDKHLVEQEQRVIAFTQQQIQEKEGWIHLLSQFTPDPPDISLNQVDPGLYNEQKAYYDFFHSQAGQMQQAVAQQKHNLEQQNELKNQQFMKRQTEQLYKLHPDLQDAEGFKKFSGRLAESFIPHYGYTSEDLNNISDPRFVTLAKDAMSWQELQKSKEGSKAKIKGKPRVLKPKANKVTTPEANAQSSKAAQRLRETGDLDDFVSSLEGFDL